MSGAQPGQTAALPVTTPATEPLIGGRFAVDVGQLLPEAGGGLPAYAATDRREALEGVMAVQVPSDVPPRAAALAAPLGDVAGLLAPLGHGPVQAADGRGAWFVICPAPPGPPLWANGGKPPAPWTEAELLRCLIGPAAAALAGLHARGLTHRAIRPDNLFRAGPGQPVVLGCAWAAPPAMHQPAAFEPPYMAMCLPAGRGEGCIEDDVYALGVLALTLALGRLPGAGVSDDALIRRRLEHGSFAALALDARLPPLLADLLRVMLAEDPAQRPPPALLIEPGAARARRVAPRPVRRAQRPLAVGGVAASDVRTLAYGIARDPAAGARLLASGAADHWLRRSLDDASLAARLEEPVRRRPAESAEGARADTLLALQAVALLDPLAPLCWDGVALWPDGLGTALAVPAPEGRLAVVLEGLVAAEATAAFAALRDPQDDHAKARQTARAQRVLLQRGGWAGGAARLRYALNPLLPCRSPLLGGAPVARLADLLPALEAALMRGTSVGGLTLDAEIVAFVAARQESGLDSLLGAFADGGPPSRLALTQLRLLARLQTSQRAGKLPHLAGALAAAARPVLASWASRTRRAEKEAALTGAAAEGDLAALLAVLDDPAGHEADAAGLQQALAEAARIDAAIGALADGASGQGAAARALGREIAVGIGLAVLAASGIAALLG